MSTRVYFGGTFDPPHKGHDEMLEYVLSRDDVDFVHVVPTFLNPLHEKVQTKQLTTTQRKNIVDLWLGKYAHNSKLICEMLEIDSGQKNYTVDSLATLQKRYSPEDQWILVLGSDNLPSFHKWKNLELLVSLLSKIWIFRRGEGRESTEELSLQSGLVEVLETTISDVSSTFIREQINLGNCVDNLPIVNEVKEQLKVYLRN